MLKPFNECLRLGLTPGLEKDIRTQFPKETGMLVAQVVLPQGPSSTKIENGDVLSKVNGELITQFVCLDSMLDDNVGNLVTFSMQHAGEVLDIKLNIGDLHAITPDRFVSVAEAKFHDLSYQLARRYAIALKDPGVYVSETTSSFPSSNATGSLIQEVDNQPTPNLDAFIEVMKMIPDKKRVVI